jgi:hypothetical protein
MCSIYCVNVVIEKWEECMSNILKLVTPSNCESYFVMSLYSLKSTVVTSKKKWGFGSWQMKGIGLGPC